MTEENAVHEVVGSTAQLLLEFAPLASAVLLFAALYVGLRRLFRSQQAHGTGSRYREQGVSALVGLVFVLMLIITAPISDNLRGQLLSLFGIIVSAAIALSSTTIMGNLIAGFMLRAVSHLHAGDFIRTEEQFGRITERGLLHIEIQTEDSDLTTLPNLSLVQKPFTLIRASGTIISAEVSLGYDVSRTLIERALLQAAEQAELGDAFVQIRHLGDFSVVYRLCGRLTSVHQIVSRRSQLRAAMLDALHAAHIEIVSPTFMNQRQLAPQQRFIPPVAGVAEPEAGNGMSIESVLFDKAQKAELAERAKGLLGVISGELEALKKSQGALPKDDEVARAELDQRIETLGRREARIKAVLAEIRDETEKLRQ